MYIAHDVHIISTCKGPLVCDAFANGEKFADVWEHTIADVIPEFIKIFLRYQVIGS
jgi:hypothetical protein